MSYKAAQHLSDEAFCRLTGLKRPTDEAAVTVLKTAEENRSTQGDKRGRSRSASIPTHSRSGWL